MGGYASDMVVEKLADGEDKSILAVTRKGLYIIRQQAIERFIPIASRARYVATVDDSNSDGVRDVVVTTWDTNSPNVICYDPITGKKLWQYSHAQRVFTDNLGWTSTNTLPTALTVINDNRIVLTVVDKLFMLDGKTGKQLVSYDFDDQNFDLSHISEIADFNKDGVNDLLAAGIWSTNSSNSQKIVLYVLSGSNGKLIRSIEIDPLSDDLNANNHGNYIDVDLKSIDIQSMQGSSNALVIFSKDSHSYESDTTIDSMVIVNLSTGTVGQPSDELAINAGDINDDGCDDLLYHVTGETSSTLTLKDGKTGNQTWKLVVSDKLEDLTVITIDGKKTALSIRTSGDPTDNKITFARIDVLRGILLDDLEITATPWSLPPNVSTSLPDLRLSWLAKSVFAYDDDKLLIALYEGFVCISSDGDAMWDVPIFADSGVAEADITGDGTEDVLLYSRSSDMVTRRLTVIDGATRTQAWTYTVPYSDYTNGGGLANVQLVADLDNDGKRDIAGHAKDGEAYKIVELSGADGTLISEVPLAEKIYSLDFIPHTTAPSYAVTTETHSQVVDRAGTVLWSKAFVADWGSTISEQRCAEIRVLEDLNADNVPDLATLLPDKVVISSSGTWPSYADHKTYATIVGATVEYKDTFADFDGDGVSEIVIVQTVQGERMQDESTVVLSPVSGTAILEFEREPSINPACADFNGDGYFDHLIYQSFDAYQSIDGSNHIIGSSSIRNVYVVSGKDGSELKKIETQRLTGGVSSYSISTKNFYTMPAAPVDDITGDGIAELALYAYESHGNVYSFGPALQTERYIEIYDVAQGKAVRQIPFVQPATMEDISRCNTISQIGDVNGNGSKDILIDGSLVADIETGQTISMFDQVSDPRAVFINTVDSNVLGVVDGADLYYVDMTNNLAITAPVAASITGSPVRLSWDSGLEDTFTQISVDGALAGQTNDSYFDLSLSKGEHVVAIGVQDKYGKITYREITFTASKGTLRIPVKTAACSD